MFQSCRKQWQLYYVLYPEQNKYFVVVVLLNFFFLFLRKCNISGMLKFFFAPPITVSLKAGDSPSQVPGLFLVTYFYGFFLS